MSTFASMQATIREWHQAITLLDPPIKPRLRHPATEEEINRAERSLGLEFPADLRFFFLCHDGQHFYNRESGYADPLIPMMRQPPDAQGHSHYWLNGTQETVECTLAYRDDYRWFQNDRFDTFGPAKYHDQYLVFTRSENADCLVLDLLPEPDGVFGQVVLFSTQAPQLTVLAPDLETFLQSLAVDYKHGRFRPQACDHYISYGDA